MIIPDEGRDNQSPGGDGMNISIWWSVWEWEFSASPLPGGWLRWEFVISSVTKSRKSNQRIVFFLTPFVFLTSMTTSAMICWWNLYQLIRWTKRHRRHFSNLIDWWISSAPRLSPVFKFEWYERNHWIIQVYLSRCMEESNWPVQEKALNHTFPSWAVLSNKVHFFERWWFYQFFFCRSIK